MSIDDDLDKRYKVDNFHSKSLEGNPINSPVDLDISIYLPPGYFESKEKRYPVIYFLHGYAGNNKGWTVSTLEERNKVTRFDLIPKKIREQIDIDRLLIFETLDELIINGDLSPFIFVQPDGSLHIPNQDGTKNFRGEIMTKGSYYVNSPYTGKYRDYIIKDVIDYIDTHYRTLPVKQHRALEGGSMGGYGVLSLCSYHPEKFMAAVSLSPGNITAKRLNWKLRIPLYEKMFGKKFNDKVGDSAWGDIINTFDIISSKDNPLLPSIKRDENGIMTDYDNEAFNNWEKYNLNNVIKENPEAFKELHLQLNCEKTDEFGLTQVSEEIHAILSELGVDHEFEIYSDKKTVMSPHIFGIGYHILPGIRFCLKYIS